MKRFIPLFILGIAITFPAAAAEIGGSDALTIKTTGGSRIKDLTSVEGARDNQLTAYGLVVGLAGTGDSRTVSQTAQTIANMLQRYGVNVPAETLRSGNVAAVMVTADIGAFARAGSRIDVIISSIGDSKTLQGGVLLQTPLVGADNAVYAVAQGPIAVGGFLGGEGGPGGATVQKNHPTVGTIPNGAIVERDIPSQLVRDGAITLLLRDPDFTSAARVAEAVNTAFPSTAVATDAGSVNVKVPLDYVPYEVNFLATIGSLEVVPDSVARVVINERTGTIIATANVRVSKVAISHGSLTISIASTLTASQPGGGGMFNNNNAGQTVVVPNTATDVTEQIGGFEVVQEAPTIDEVAAALNALGVSTRDMMSIFQSMKSAGALQAELVLN